MRTWGLFWPRLSASPGSSSTLSGNGAHLADSAAEGLYTAVEGTRHDAHFDAVRYWAYSVNLGGNLSTWLARVNEVSDQLHGRIPVTGSAHRYSRTQSRTNAVRVATFTWNIGTDYLADYSTEAQRRRIVKRWHGQGSEAKVLQVDALHASIRFDFGQGLSVAEIARGSMYTPRHIFRIVAAEREATMRRRNDLIRDYARDGASVSKTAAAFGLSRRHVYRVLESVT